MFSVLCRTLFSQVPESYMPLVGTPMFVGKGEHFAPEEAVKGIKDRQKLATTERKTMVVQIGSAQVPKTKWLKFLVKL